ncbi:hypothetical protein EI94DRAFT_1704878 [Lactarius quietus]|nr:hypothetical protein EI94DRAFT_1704878 [Lactarius quietus]
MTALRNAPPPRRSKLWLKTTEKRVVQLERQREWGYRAPRTTTLRSRLLVAAANCASRMENTEPLLGVRTPVRPETANSWQSLSAAALISSKRMRSLTMPSIASIGHVHDTQCGFKPSSRDAARVLLPR